MTAEERRQKLLEEFNAIMAENHFTPADAAREARSGRLAARREELAPCAAWTRWSYIRNPKDQEWRAK